MARVTYPVQLSVLGDIQNEGEESPQSAGQRRIHRVPPELRLNKESSQHLFDPVIVSLGPYHYGKPNLSRAEKLKDEILAMFLSYSRQSKGSLYSQILERIDKIRASYVGVTKNEYNDEKLAEMMLRDGVFTVVYLIRMPDAEEFLYAHLGMSGFSFMFRDIIMLENQIPYSLIKLLFQLGLTENEGNASICTFLSIFGDERLTRVPCADDGEEPLHLLDVCRMALLQIEKADQTSRPHCFPNCIWPGQLNEETEHTFQRVTNQFRSVTNLAGKGIRFIPSSNCLRDIKFSSCVCYGLLSLPIWFVSSHSKVFFSNIFAFEMSPESQTQGEITSYIDFMKSLIESVADVKKLREKGILFSTITDGEVVELFKQIDTQGMGNPYIFGKVRKRLNNHCNSKRKTWMADFFRNYCSSPWTAIALLAATFLLFLTFSQTYLALLAQLSESKNQPK